MRRTAKQRPREDAKRDSASVLRFRVTLKHVAPPIWRVIEVPRTYTFWDLHVALQDAMGWLDCHLHEFSLADPATGRTTRIGIPPMARTWRTTRPTRGSAHAAAPRLKSTSIPVQRTIGADVFRDPPFLSSTRPTSARNITSE